MSSEERVGLSDAEAKRLEKLREEMRQLRAKEPRKPKANLTGEQRMGRTAATQASSIAKMLREDAASGIAPSASVLSSLNSLSAALSAQRLSEYAKESSRG